MKKRNTYIFVIIKCWQMTYGTGDLNFVVDITTQTVVVLGVQFELAVLGDPFGFCLGACLIIVRLRELLDLSCSSRNLTKLLASVPSLEDSVQDLLVNSPAGAAQHIETVVN